ncbi:MAG: PP2C family protein-serine/threonine phosphatase [Trueperaceae bacterium]|nr:PP2C family protein-serine/threonine phosphatase [Trueperaceae bacterium]
MSEVPTLRRLLPTRRAGALLEGFGPLLGRLRVRLSDGAGAVLAEVAGPQAVADAPFAPVATWSLAGAPDATLGVAPAPDGAGEAVVVELLRRTVFDVLEAAHARRAIAAETLDRYREIHLLYRVGEALAGTLDPLEVPRRALAEARAVIASDAGAVWLEAEAGEDGESSTLGDAAEAVAPTLAALADPLRATVVGADGPWGPRVWAPLASDGALRGGVLLTRAPGAEDFAAGDAKLLAALATQATAFLDVARLHRRALAQERMERELQLAFEVQARLMPRGQASRPGWDVAAHWRPAREVSGDFYDAIDVGDELGLIVADVADKGMPAALFMAVVRSLLRASVGADRSPAEAVMQTNRWACRDATDGTFVTLWYGQFARDGRVRYVNGGHNPPIVLRRDGRLERLARTGILVGWDPDVAYGEAEVTLAPDDLLIAYTDGVTEALAPDGAEYGEARFERVLRAAAGGPAHGVLEAVRADLERFTAGAEPFDDVTLLVARRAEGTAP